MLRIAVVDDDEEDLSRIRAYLDQYFAAEPREYSVSSFSDGEDLLLQKPDSFDLLFLDVEMRWSNGIDIARTLRERGSDLVILFISRIAQYAVEGYSVDALDYLLKPVAYEEFAVKLGRALRQIDARQPFRIRLSQGGDHRWLSSDAIRYVEVFGHHLVYHTTEGQFRTTDTIGAAAGQLVPLGFLQCSRFCLANPRFVTGVDGNTLLLGEDRVSISRRRRKEFVDALLRYHGGIS